MLCPVDAYKDLKKKVTKPVNRHTTTLAVEPFFNQTLRVFSMNSL